MRATAASRPAGLSSRELTPPRGRRAETHQSSAVKSLLYHQPSPPSLPSSLHTPAPKQHDTPSTAANSSRNSGGSHAARSSRREALDSPCDAEQHRGAALSSAGSRMACLRGDLTQQSSSELMAERTHAADRMVIPTVARARASAPLRAGKAPLVPVGRDLPIGLDITSFLGPANPFGQQPVRPKKGPSDEELMQMLTEPCDAMSRVLSARLSHLRVVRAMWATSVRRALQYTLDMDDQPVLVDVLNSSQQPLACEMSLELAQDLLPAVGRLVDSEYEDYIICGLTTLSTILKVIGQQLREVSQGAACGLLSLGVDLQMEERIERCAALRDILQEVHPRLNVLAQGKGRSGQLAARMCKSLARSLRI